MNEPDRTEVRDLARDALKKMLEHLVATNGSVADPGFAETLREVRFVAESEYVE